MTREKSRGASDGALRGALRIFVRRGTGACPDDDTMAAYLDDGLSQAERTPLEKHLSRCADCQQVLHASLQPEVSSGASERESPTRISRWVPARTTLSLAASLFVAAVILGLMVPRLRESLPPGPMQLEEAEKSTEAPTRQSSDILPESKLESEVPKPRSAAPVGESVRPEDPKRDHQASLREPGALLPEQNTLPNDDRARSLADSVEEEHYHALPTDRGDVATARQATGPTAVADDGQGPSVKEKMATFEGRRRPARTTAEPAAMSSAATNGSFVAPRAVVAELNRRLTRSRAQEAVAQKQVQSMKRRVASASSATTTVVLNGRPFHNLRGYWIDERCASRGGDQFHSIDTRSSEFGKILEQFPRIDELLPTVAAVIVYWNDKVFVIEK